MKYSLLVSLCLAIGLCCGEAFSADPKEALPEGAEARLGTPIMAHGQSVLGLTFAPGGELVSLASDNTLAFWDVKTARLVRKLHIEDEGPRGGFVSNATTRAQMFFSPNGKLAAVQAGTRGMQLVDLAKGKSVIDSGRGGRLSSLSSGVAFSPDSSMFALVNNRVGTGKNVELFDTTTGQTIDGFPDIEGGVLGLVFLPDNRTLATAGEDQAIRLWDIKTGKETKLIEGHRAAVLSLAVSPDGKQLASSSEDGTARIWDLAAYKELQRFAVALPSLTSAPGGRPISALARSTNSTQLSFSRDGKQLRCELSGRCQMWDVNAGKPIPFSEPTRGSTVCALSSDGKFWAASKAHGIITLVDLTTGKEIQSSDERTAIQAFALSPDGKLLAAGGTDFTVRLWDLQKRTQIRRMEGHTGVVGFLGFSQDGKTLISASYDSSDRAITVWDVETGKETRTIRSGQRNTLTASFSNDGKILASLDTRARGGMILVANILDNKEVGRVTATTLGPTQVIQLSPDGKLLATNSREGLIVFDLAKGKEVFKQPDVGRGNGLPLAATFFFSDDSSYVGMQSAPGAMRVWHIASGKAVFRVGEGNNEEIGPGGPAGPGAVGVGVLSPARNRDSVVTPTFSPDGRSIVGIDKHGDAIVRDLFSGEVKQRFAGGATGAITDAKFTPDGRSLITSSTDGTMMFWDLRFVNKEAKAVAAKLTAEQAAGFWNDLSNPKTGLHAGRVLRCASEISLKLLKDRLKPATPTDVKQIEKLIADLDNGEFAVRNKASLELEKIGEQAETLMRKTLTSGPSVEVEKRINELLQKLDGLPQGERLREYRALEILEQMGTKESRDFLEHLAGGAEGTWLTQEAKRTLQRMRLSEGK